MEPWGLVETVNLKRVSNQIRSHYYIQETCRYIRCYIRFRYLSSANQIAALILLQLWSNIMAIICCLEIFNIHRTPIYYSVKPLLASSGVIWSLCPKVIGIIEVSIALPRVVRNKKETLYKGMAAGLLHYVNLISTIENIT